MSFSLDEFTKVKILDVDVLSQKNRPPNAKPGVMLHCSVELSNHVLTHFDGYLRGTLYRKTAASDPQQGIEGVEPVSDLPNLTAIGRRLSKFGWHVDYTGYEVTIDYGTGGKSNLVLKDSKLHSFQITPKEGGTCTVQWKSETNDVEEKVFGKLATLKSRDTQMLLTPPEVTQEDMGGGSVDGHDDDEPESDHPDAGSPFPVVNGQRTPESEKNLTKPDGGDANAAFLAQHGD